MKIAGIIGFIALAQTAGAVATADEPAKAPAAHKTDAGAGDPTKVSPATHKLAYADQDMRVLDIHLPANGHANMHSHPHGYYFVALTDCKIKFTFPDGKTQEATVHAGDMAWSDPVTHAADNLAGTECHVINVEPRHGHARKAAQAAEKK
ncbi:MAG: hypothetical protein PVSMB6_12020 [Steroidobacteraceae bacterium]